MNGTNLSDMIEKYGVAVLIRAIAQTCHEKGLAIPGEKGRAWDRDSTALDSLSDRLEN